jgi:FkbM family methyltransferase
VTIDDGGVLFARHESQRTKVVQSIPNVKNSDCIMEKIIQSLKLLIARTIINDRFGSLLFRMFGNKVRHRGTTLYIERKFAKSRAAIFWNLYERAEVDQLRKYLRPDLDVIELGASLGVVSTQVLKILNPGKKLVSVEANPNLRDCLTRNINLNTNGQLAEVLSAAVSYDGEEIEIDIGLSNLTTSLSKSAGSTGNSRRVKTITLKSILEKHSITDFQLVCDIEGAEIQIISNDAKSLQKCSLLIIELHETSFGGIDYSPREIVDKIQKETALRVINNDGMVYVFSKCETH